MFNPTIKDRIQLVIKFADQIFISLALERIIASFETYIKGSFAACSNLSTCFLWFTRVPRIFLALAKTAYGLTQTTTKQSVHCTHFHTSLNVGGSPEGSCGSYLFIKLTFPACVGTYSKAAGILRGKWRRSGRQDSCARLLSCFWLVVRSHYCAVTLTYFFSSSNSAQMVDVWRLLVFPFRLSDRGTCQEPFKVCAVASALAHGHSPESRIGRCFLASLSISKMLPQRTCRNLPPNWRSTAKRYWLIFRENRVRSATSSDNSFFFWIGNWFSKKLLEYGTVFYAYSIIYAMETTSSRFSFKKSSFRDRAGRGKRAHD